MPTRRLGKTDLHVPILQMGGTYPYTHVLVRRALELGVNAFDLADCYVNGRAEQTFGRIVQALGCRKKIIITTKGHPASPDQIEKSWLPRSLQRLRTDYVDLWLIHNLADPAVLLARDWRLAVERARASGKMRFFGFSCHNQRLVELLEAAARSGFVDAVLLRYNFRSYGDAALNRAMDRACKAGIGLIAMKTQGSAISFAERVNPFRSAGYSKHQAVLKAVWQDQRIASCVSAMPSLRVLEQNAAAARQPLAAAERELLRRWASTTSRWYCPGGSGRCRRQCEQAMPAPVAIADVLRYLMYYDSYGLRRQARQLFAGLPKYRRPDAAADFAPAERACPHHLPITILIRRAASLLS